MTMSIVRNKIQEFVDAKKGFTSVDIANAIKTDGTWVRNREVASCLRSHFSVPVGYGVSRVTVELQDGTTTQASIYLPNNLCVSDYSATAQLAMTPAEFEALHGFNPVATAMDPAPVVDPHPDASDNGSPNASVGDKLRALFHWAPGS